MGGSSTTSSKQSTSTQLPQWVLDAGQSNYNRAQDMANGSDPMFQGNVAVGPNGVLDKSYQTAVGNAGQVATGIGGLVGEVQANNLQPFMNPYTQDVVNTSEKALSDSLAQSQNANNANSLTNNAFGGSRAGVQAGVTASQGALAAGQLAAKLNSDNFNQAQTAFNQNAGLRLNGLNAIGGAQNNDLNNLLQAGGNEQQISQNYSSGAAAAYNQPAQYRQQMLGLLESTLGQTPYNTTTNQSGTSTKSSSPDFATALLGGLKLGASFIPGGNILGSFVPGVGSSYGG